MQPFYLRDDWLYEVDRLRNTSLHQKLNPLLIINITQALRYRLDVALIIKSD